MIVFIIPATESKYVTTIMKVLFLQKALYAYDTTPAGDLCIETFKSHKLDSVI